MGTFIFALVLLLLALAGVVIRKTYYYLPPNELKRQAERHDSLAECLYRAVAYGGSLRGLLWLFISLTSAGGFVLLARIAPVWLSLLAVVTLLWAAFSWLPASKVSSFGAKLTSFVTPFIAWLLNYFHPILSRTVMVAEKRYSAPRHTGLFERSDVLELIDRQQQQSDNRLTDEELEIAKRALSFSEHSVAEILTPKKQIKTVLADETVGPILIDELHKTSQEYVLVKDKPKGMIVGALQLKDLGIHSQGKVSDLMDSKVYYVHEDDSLSATLHAFYATNHPLFIVVNSFEEYVGIISVENILHQLLGHIPGDDFDQFDNVAAVAARHTRKEIPEKPDETPEEVVE